MAARVSFAGLSEAEWKRIDGLFEALLDLDAAAQEQRIAAIEAHSPIDGAALRELLSAGSRELRLNTCLRSALGYLSGNQIDPAGTRIGAWRLLRLIGRGGMSEVYLAERADEAFKGEVALKLLLPGLAHGRAAERVRQERQILANLDDSRFARLIDGGVTEQGQPWLAMELVEGRPLLDACGDPALDLAARVALFLEIAEAIGAAHRQWIVHGDLKPGNVLVTAEGRIKVLDFGIGRLQRQEDPSEDASLDWRAHSPRYASPEQREGRALSPASDVYQLGGLLAEMVRLQPARGGRFREIEAIVARAQADAPRERYADAGQLAADVRRWQTRQPVAAVPHSAWYAIRCLLRRRWGALGLTLVLLTVGALTLYRDAQQTRAVHARSATNEAVLGFLEDMLGRGDPYRSQDLNLVSGPMLEEAATRLAQLDAQPEAKARVLTTLGRIHRNRSELLLAEARYSEALALARQHGLPDALDQALQGMAAVGIWSGDYRASEALLRELINRRRDMGSSVTHIDGARLWLADLLHSRGEYGEALRLTESVHAARQLSHWSGRVLGMIERDLGRWQDADRHFRASEEILRGLDPGHPERLSELTDHFALLRLHQGDLADARRMLAESEQLRAGFLGQHWQGLVWTRHWNAVHALASGDLGTAASLLDIMLADYARFFGESSHLLAFARSDRGYVALGSGQADQAGALFHHAIERLQSLRTGGHPRLAEPLLGLALLESAEGRPEAALSAARRALALREALPLESEGRTLWRGNACRIVQRLGGRCEGAAGALGNDLDALRLRRGIEGLCARAVQNHRRLGLCASQG
jgi:tetratricopeptide (TPR) repeat protein